MASPIERNPQQIGIAGIPRNPERHGHDENIKKFRDPYGQVMEKQAAIFIFRILILHPVSNDNQIIIMTHLVRTRLLNTSNVIFLSKYC